MSHLSIPDMSKPTFSRRRFIGTTGASIAIAGFPAIISAQTANERVLKIGLIGAGGRGTSAATQALAADPNVKLWAIGDAFAEAHKDLVRMAQIAEADVE